MATYKIDKQSVMDRLTLHVEVTGETRWRLRQWLGRQFLKAAARVMGCNIVIVPRACPGFKTDHDAPGFCKRCGGLQQEHSEV